jgi:hypothetical protein
MCKVEARLTQHIVISFHTHCKVQALLAWDSDDARQDIRLISA